MTTSGILNTMARPLPPSIQNLTAQARWAYPVLVVLTAFGIGKILGLSIGLLTLAGGVLCGTIWLLWASLQGLTGDAPLTLDEALSLGAPSAEEEQKRAVLRALKDLEYERAVGKINDADYASLAEHYRNEAKRLLRAVDEDLGPERERAEKLLAERLAEREAAAPPAGASVDAETQAVDAARNSDADESDDSAEPAVAKSPSSGAAP
ncbi:MAG: hypothetical protein RL033_5297 [Pseudomonadota bacterium]|jgi:hypothetical protein